MQRIRPFMAGLLVAISYALVDEVQGGDAALDLDLNNDQIADSSATFDDCDDGSGRHCLVVRSALFPSPRFVAIENVDAQPASTSTQTISHEDPIRVIGDHTGDGLAEIALLYVRERAGPSYAPAMAIVDIGTQSLLAEATSPPALSTFETYPLKADVLFPSGADGRVYPALTPGYGDSNNVAAMRWGWGCLFRPGAGSTDCGPGFIRIDTVPDTLPYGGTVWFRESIGHVADIDDDGWEDLQLPYHGAFLSISGRTGNHLATTSYDVAATTGAQPLMFHSGRQYGVHHTVYAQPQDSAAVAGRSSASFPIRRTVIIAGSPLGDFDNPMCNVSRYTAVLVQDGGPSTRRLAWADFDGFHSNNWSSWPFVPPGGEAPVPSRWGDFADTCIHRYADGRTIMDGEEALLVNYFTTDWSHPDNASLAGRCKDEQYQLYMQPTWTAAKQEVWNACALRHAATKGRWSMKVLREADGTTLTGSSDTYVWGWSQALHPSGEVLYLVEQLPNPVRFDIRDDSGSRIAPSELRVRALVGGQWSDRGALPVAGRPILTDVPKTRNLGTGDFYEVSGLSLADLDGDGFAEVAIAIESGAEMWIGWSASTGSWTAKTGAAQATPFDVLPPPIRARQPISNPAQRAPVEKCVRVGGS